MKIDLKFGKGKVNISVPKSQIIGIYEPKKVQEIKDVSKAVRKSLQNPIDTKRIRDISKPGKKVAIVVDDITRKVPTKDILIPIVDELLIGGVKKEDICVIVATGLHRGLTNSEHKEILGRLYREIEIINHDAYKKEGLTFLCKTRLGTDVHINKRFYESDIKILTGDIEYHQFCGYGGGAKSVFPGLGDKNSIELSHSRMEYKGTGPGRIKGNPIREEIEEVGRKSGVDFIVNVVLNAEGEVAGIFSGDISKAFLEGTRLCDKIYRARVPKRIDVVIASAGGYPRDIDLYQAQKAIEGARRVVKKSGKIILIAECREGYGSRLFREWVREANRLEDIFKKIHKRFIMGGHKAYQIASAIEWADIYLYSKIKPNLVREAFMYPIREISHITDLIRKDEEVIVLPQATLTLAIPKRETNIGFLRG